eukprot:TRINITY_DN102_c0_g1_i13.p1 TRINITY_DN102_c0_g1~~TRINITY_DN102_c0_g1_i13.p1  ORF type:complete len:866 (-),score=175.01 TRINITY_DN102_c0_g1_i13:5874-8471(-)
MTSMGFLPHMQQQLLKELEFKNARPKSAPTDPDDDTPTPPLRKQPAFEVISSFLSATTTTAPQTYLAFYEALRRSSVATYYLSSLISKAYTLEVGDDRTLSPADLQRMAGLQEFSAGRSAGDEKESSVTLKQNIIHTIFYVCLFYPFDGAHPVLKHLHSLWQNASVEKGRVMTAPDAISFHSLVARLLASNYLESKESLLALTELVSNAEIVRDSSTLVVDSSSAKNLSSSLIFSYLKTSLEYNRRVDNIYEGLLTLLRHPSMRSGRLLCLLQLLKEYIQIRSPSTSCCQTLIQIVRQFYLWPLPYGALAKELLEMLVNELKFPGCSLRETFYSDFPQLRPNVVYKGYRDQAVAFFVNQDSVSGKEIMDYILSTQGFEPLPEQLVTSLLSDAFETILAMPVGTIPFWKYASQQLYGYYAELMQITKDILQMDPASAPEERVARVSALRDQILADTPLNSTNQHGVIMKPKLPHLFLDAQQIPDEKLESITFHRTTLSPLVTCHQSLQFVLKNSVATARQRGWTGESPLPIRIAVAATDVALHKIICAYYLLRVSQPDLFNNIQPRFFLVPLGAENHLASFISRHDPWYQRLVYSGVPSALRLLPGLNGKANRKLLQSYKTTDDFLLIDEMFMNPAKPDEKDIPMEAPNPSTLFLSSIESYLRQAKREFQVSVFQCEAYVATEDKDAPEEKRIIPFIQRVEFGTSQPKVSASGSMRSLKGLPAEISIKFTQTSIAGISKVTTVEAKPYQTIVMTKITKQTDKAHSPDRPQIISDPSQSTLDVFLTEIELKKKSKSKGSAPDMPTVYVGQVSSIELNTGDRTRGLEITIDDQPAGSFHRIVLTEAKIQGSPESSMSFPIATFFPVQS